VAFLTKTGSIMTEVKLKDIVMKSVLQWAQEEYDVNDDDWSFNDRFNHNLETFIELLQEEVL
jgi:hypothetical protein